VTLLHLKDTTIRKAKTKMERAAIHDASTKSPEQDLQMSVSAFAPTIDHLIPKDSKQRPHCFETITFKKAPYCGVCHDLLTGRIMMGPPQGKQCKTCGLVVHHDGPGRHSKCYAEAMARPCTPGGSMEVKRAASTDKTEKSRNQAAATVTATTAKTEFEQDGMGMKIISNILPSSYPAAAAAAAAAERGAEGEDELPHKFVEHSYASPTYCNICNGILVGLWSQGFQCETCGLNVHRGEGIGDHDDCKAEALFKPCPGRRTEEQHSVTLAEAIQKSPNFWKDFKEQADRDLMTHVKDAVVAGGIENERSKNLRRIREKLVPAIEALDAIEALGEVHTIFVLIRLHLIVAFLVSATSVLIFIMALFPKFGFGLFNTSIIRLAVVHELTILGTINIFVLAIAFVLRYFAILFRRKSMIVEKFLVDMLSIDSEVDIGISMKEASIRARAWSQRITISASFICATALVAWSYYQPTMEELKWALSKDNHVFYADLPLPPNEL